FCDLCLPFERHVVSLDIFKIGKGKAEIFLDPRLEGYINTSQKFGEVREFTSPRNALGVLTSIDDPLPIDLKLGARGRVCFFNFEIVFKVGLPVKEKIFKNLPKIERNFFQPPSSDSPIEKYIFPISILVTVCLFIPVINWLLNFPSQKVTGLLSIPVAVTAEFIAPENMRLLPFIFGESYVPETTPQQALLWVYELQTRWENAEQGLNYASMIPFLAKSNSIDHFYDSLTPFQNKIKDQYKQTEAQRKLLAQKERYYTFLKKSPMFGSILSGNQGESNYNTITKRIGQMQQADKAIVEYLKLDHKILKDFYQGKYNAKKLGIVDPPQTGQVLGPQPDPIFSKELASYKEAEFFAQIADESDFRLTLKGVLEQEEKEQKNSFNSEVVFLADGGLVYPYEFMDERNDINQQEEFNTFLDNAIFSDAFILPPPSKPKPYVDLKMVQFVVFNKKEEVRSCYNSALRKNIYLNGDITLSWNINEHGQVSNIQMLKSNMKHENLFRCIASRIKTWKFPKSKNGIATVKFPFKFFYLKKE
ncbi:MAG: AgmX/PglI C-terminal domain-containing protein, partial [Bdellovibrionota bacterium]